jgi:signal transduction histidine kinase
LAVGDPGGIVDAGLAVAGIGLTAVAVTGLPYGLIDTTIIGPSWLLALLPVLLGAPLALRRRAPLLMWGVIWAGLVLQSRYTQSVPAAAFTFVLLIAAYSLGAHASLRRAVAGLVVAAPFVVEISHHGKLGIVDAQHGGKVSVLLSTLTILAFWLAGVLVRTRRQAVSLAARSAALQRQAEQAAAAERARIARELHDIVAHHLSVVVLHAAGARASGRADPEILAEIEASGRMALTETRRLFEVLRKPDDETGRAPQPGISQLPALAGSLRAAGLDVNLSIDGDHMSLSPALNVSTYRIVQEALTNVLKHAGPARAEVTVGCAGDAVTIKVTDDGQGTPVPEALTGGHGLAGMRERAALFGGDLEAGPRPGGGFAVSARLPIGGPS